MENLIKALFNIDSNDIEKLEVVQNEKDLTIRVRLKKKETVFCPLCGKKLIGNGTKDKPINH